MLSPYEKDKIREGVLRIREEVPEAIEEQMYRMLLFVVAKNGNPFNDDDAAEARKLIQACVKEFNVQLN